MATKDKKRDYIISNRIMTVVIACFVVMIALVFIARGYEIIDKDWQATVFILNSLVISIPSVLLALGLLYFFKQRGKEDKVMSGSFVLGLAVILFVLGLAIRLNPYQAIDMAYILVPVLAVLYIVYYSFQRECFTLALAIALGAIGLYILYKIIDYSVLAFWGLPLCILLAVIALLYGGMMMKASKSAGCLKLGKRKIRVGEPKGIYLPCYLYSLVAAISFVAVGILGRTAAYYAFFVTAGCALLFGLYYTIKLAQNTKA